MLFGTGLILRRVGCAIRVAAGLRKKQADRDIAVIAPNERAVGHGPSLDQRSAQQRRDGLLDARHIVQASLGQRDQAGIVARCGACKQDELKVVQPDASWSWVVLRLRQRHRAAPTTQGPAGHAGRGMQPIQLGRIQ